jgi:hypothetical protein
LPARSEQYFVIDYNKKRSGGGTPNPYVILTISDMNDEGLPVGRQGLRRNGRSTGIWSWYYKNN